MNKQFLRALDVVKFKVYDNSRASDIPRIVEALRHGFWLNKKKFKALMESIGYFETSDWTFEKNGNKINIDNINRQIDSTDFPEVFNYAIVIPFLGMPFVMYMNDEGTKLVPYTCIQDDEPVIYRHPYVTNDSFSNNALNKYIYDDLFRSMGGDTSNVDMSNTFGGNKILGYLYLILGLLGITYPESWCENGVPDDMITDELYGFEETK